MRPAGQGFLLCLACDVRCPRRWGSLGLSSEFALSSFRLPHLPYQSSLIQTTSRRLLMPLGSFMSPPGHPVLSFTRWSVWTVPTASCMLALSFVLPSPGLGCLLFARLGGGVDAVWQRPEGEVVSRQPHQLETRHRLRGWQGALGSSPESCSPTAGWVGVSGPNVWPGDRTLPQAQPPPCLVPGMTSAGRQRGLHVQRPARWLILVLHKQTGRL